MVVLSRVALDISTLEDETPIMSRNIGHQSQSSPALRHRRTKISGMVRRPKAKRYSLLSRVTTTWLVRRLLRQERHYIVEVPLSQALII